MAQWAPAIERFQAKINETASGCWEWTGAVNNYGYGRFHDGCTVYAHRWAYLHFVGPIPDGFDIDHLCRNPPCVNPEHLEAVPHSENIRRGFEAKNQTHCKRGHDLSVSARLTKDGRRDCRECEKVRRSRRQESETHYSVKLPGRKEAA